MLTSVLLLATAQVTCLLSERWGGAVPPAGSERNFVLVIDERPVWNGVPIDFQTLDLYVETVADMRPRPVLVLEGAAAKNCATLLIIARRIEQRGRCTAETCVVSYRPISPKERDIPPLQPAI
jgi:hypothetical protein